MQSFYRFRSVKYLLERKELEHQEIYFASPEQLNDPLEGYKDLFWQGDDIVWRNLFRHYLLCLLHAYVVTKVGGQDCRLTLAHDNPVVARFALPTPKSRDIYNRICSRFFGSTCINEVPTLLAQCHYRFGGDALEFFLRAIHNAALDAVFQVYGDDGLEPAANAFSSAAEQSETVVSTIKQALSVIAADDQSINAEALSLLFSVSSQMAKQVELIAYLQKTDEHFRAWQPLLTSFPEHYVDQLRHFVFFKWYAACFVVDPNHAAMWGNYGDSHRGICLRFRAHDGVDGKPTLTLRRAFATKDEQRDGDIPLTFDAITYVNKLKPVDFFRSLARVPIPDLKSDWYTDETGNRSKCGDGVLSSQQEWHSDNWTAFQALTTTKLRPWEHEREHRLVLTSGLDAYSEVEDRKLHYQFADLEGIVFGIRTPLSEKEKIINIILAKCEREGRKDFTFSQALYVPYSGRIETRPLDLLRIS